MCLARVPNPRQCLILGGWSVQVLHRTRICPCHRPRHLLWELSERALQHQLKRISMSNGENAEVKVRLYLVLWLRPILRMKGELSWACYWKGNRTRKTCLSLCEEDKRRLNTPVYGLNGDIESWLLLPGLAVFRRYSWPCSQIWKEESSTSNKNLEPTDTVGESRKIWKTWCCEFRNNLQRAGSSALLLGE